MIEAWMIWEGMALLFCIRMSFAVLTAVTVPDTRKKALADIYFLIIGIIGCFTGVVLTYPNGG